MAVVMFCSTKVFNVSDLTPQLRPGFFTGYILRCPVTPGTDCLAEFIQTERNTVKKYEPILAYRATVGTRSSTGGRFWECCSLVT